MKHKNTNRYTKTLNPFLGFGWSTGTKFLKQDVALNNQFCKIQKENIHNQLIIIK